MSNKPLQEKVPQLAIMITELYQNMIAQKEFIVSKQLFRSGTSIGDNEAEAQSAASKRDFIAKLIISNKECNETLFWLKLIRDTQIVRIDVVKEIKLAQDISNLLHSIIKTAQENLAKEENEKLKIPKNT